MPSILINTALEEETSPTDFIKGYLCFCCQNMAPGHEALRCHNLLCCFCKSKHTENSVQNLLKNGQEYCVTIADAICIGNMPASMHIMCHKWIHVESENLVRDTLSMVKRLRTCLFCNVLEIDHVE